MNKIILHLCADIGSDSKPYKEAGYEIICVGKDIGVENYHPPKHVYGIIANPPCTEFSWCKTTGKPRDLEKGLEAVRECQRIIWESQELLNGDYSKQTTLQFWMLENPKGLLQKFLGRPVFEYSPYEFGDAYKKTTQIWGFFNIPEKTPISSQGLFKFDKLKTKEIHYEGNEHLTRTERRSICSPGFAKAFFQANS